MSEDKHVDVPEATVPEAKAPEYDITEHHDSALPAYDNLPKGWIYKKFPFIGGRVWFASPKVQLLMIAIVCFLCPGMFNALGGLGGAGTSDSSANSKANTALYSTFAVVGFFAGTITNRLGIRFATTLGGLGYCIYAASFLSWHHTHNQGFVIFAGAFLGVCAGLLWCAQGAIMMSYPTEENKGKYISFFWIIFNFGAVIGALIPLAQTVNSSDASAVNDSTYIAFIVLMFAGAVIAMFLVNGNRVIRDDGSKVILMKNPSWSTELLGLWQTLSQQPIVLLLFPMFFASNIFYTYQMNNFNGAYFTIRTRSLNNLLYWLAQIIGAVINGYFLDMERFTRTQRARISFVFLFVLTMGIWGGGYAWQKDKPTREFAAIHGADGLKDFPWIDWKDSDYLGGMFLYFFYGFYDAIWQTSIYWYMGALSNSGRKAANLAGFYKGIQSAGAAVFWALDSDGVAFMTMFASSWGLLAGSLLIASPLIWFRISDHVSMEEDLKFSDETVEDVAGYAAEKQIDV